MIQDESLAVLLPHAPGLPHLRFRYSSGEADYCALFTVHEGSRATDHTDLQSSFEPYHGLVTTVEDIAAAFRWCDPAKDVLIAEIVCSH